MKEMLKRLQDRHVEYAQVVAKKADADADSVVTVSQDTPNVLETMMQLSQAKTRSTIKHDRLIVLSKSSLLGWLLQVSLIVIIKGRSPIEVSLIVIIKQVSS